MPVSFPPLAVLSTVTATVLLIFKVYWVGVMRREARRLTARHDVVNILANTILAVAIGGIGFSVPELKTIFLGGDLDPLAVRVFREPRALRALFSDDDLSQFHDAISLSVTSHRLVREDLQLRLHFQPTAEDSTDVKIAYTKEWSYRWSGQPGGDTTEWESVVAIVVRRNRDSKRRSLPTGRLASVYVDDMLLDLDWELNHETQEGDTVTEVWRARYSVDLPLHRVTRIRIENTYPPPSSYGPFFFVTAEFPTLEFAVDVTWDERTPISDVDLFVFGSIHPANDDRQAFVEPKWSNPKRGTSWKSKNNEWLLPGSALMIRWELPHGTGAIRG